MPDQNEPRSATAAAPTYWRRATQALSRLSLRARLLVGVLVLVAAGLVVSDVAATSALGSYLVGRVDQELQAAIDNPVPFEQQLRTPGSCALALGGTATGLAIAPATPFRMCTTPGQTAPSPPQLPSIDQISVDAPFTAPAQRSGAPSWRILATPTSQQGRVLILGTSLSGVETTMGRLELIEALVTLAVLIMVAVVSRWVVRLGLRPLDEMGETAGAIAAGDLSRRVEPAEGDTEVGRLGLALNAMLARIEDAFEAQRASEERLRRFVADASHELRTPLTSIRGYAELFRRGAGDRPDDLAAAMRRIEEESIRMGGLVEDLLLLARLDQGRPLERARVDLAAVATDAVADARAADPGRPLYLDAPGQVPVLGDKARLYQVAANLLSNARQHTPGGTRVSVSARLQGGRAVLEVSDDGPGLSPADAGRVFERFFRADASRTRGRGGAGLGLSIVAAITEAHGGRVSVESAPGEGATFRVDLPADVGGAPTGGSPRQLGAGGSAQVSHPVGAPTEHSAGA